MPIRRSVDSLIAVGSVRRMIALLLAGIVLLAAVLFWAVRDLTRLRARHGQRGLLGKWPIPQVSVESIHPRFRTDELGVTLDAEVHFVGRGDALVPGGTSDSEAWILAVLAKDARRMFEFGTCTGKTAYLWARNQPPGGTVTTLTLAPDQVDTYRSEPGDDAGANDFAVRESRFHSFLYSPTAAASAIEQLFGDSKAFDDTPFHNTMDVVFIDGSHAHSYVASDTAKAMRMVRPGGLVLWHDYTSEVPGVFEFLNRLARTLDLVHVRGTRLVVWRRTATDVGSVAQSNGRVATVSPRSV